MKQQLSEQFQIVVFDTETTGLSQYHDEIIEIGAIRYDKGVVTDRYSVFIKPEKEVPLFIYKLTNITEDQLRTGISKRKALRNFVDFLKPNDILVAHNAPFDIGFVNSSLVSLKMDKLYHKTVDTCELARIFLPFLSNFKLSTLAEYFGVVNEGAHRAIHDAETTGIIYFKLIEFIVDHIPLNIQTFLSKIADYSLTNSGFSKLLEDLRNFTLKYALTKEKGDKTVFQFKNRNFIQHKPEVYQTYEMEDVFNENGLLSKKLENYELRQGQIDMSKAISEALEREEFLTVEAGTGVGKSLAYLVPAIRFSFLTNQKVVISTNTKNLQEQLLFKDLPLLEKAVNTPFSAVLIKGRENYLCHRKWQDIINEFTVSNTIQTFSPIEAFSLMYITTWAHFTKTGDVSENGGFEGSEHAFIWKRLSADRHFCSGKKCPHYGKCFLMDIRQKAEKANLVIVNHSLLLSDFQNENASLGNIDYLIFDEAHNLLHSASQHLGVSLSYPDLNGFIHSIFSVGKKYQSGILITLKTMAMKSMIINSKKENLVLMIDTMLNLIEDKKNIIDEYFVSIASLANDSNNYGKLRIKDIEKFPQIKEGLTPLVELFSNLLEQNELIHEYMRGIDSGQFVDYDTQLSNVEGISERIFEIIQLMKKIQVPELEDYALWLSVMQVKDEKYPAGVINYAPIEVKSILPFLIYMKVKSMIFTSATMALRGSFKYFISNLGLDSLKDKIVRELVVPSPFDYDKQTLILNASYLPNHTDPFFSPQSSDLIKSIIEKYRVGSMILFTSYKDLNIVYDKISEACYKQDIMLLAQGKGGSRSSILQDFKNKGDAILLGTSSFWEGVDVQGESLSLLILYKLPFQVPSDPIVEALLEKMEKDNKNSFMHYSLPNALLKMRQGFGRLIRSKSDHGIVLILDNRITTKEYGRYFKEILPTGILPMQNPVEIHNQISRWFKKM